MRDTFGRTLYDVARAEANVFLLVADISPAVSLKQFLEEYPERFINVGVAEQSLIGLAAGMALRGCKPFAYTIATFALYRPFEQVRVDLCYQNLPVTIVGAGAGLTYSTLGGTHHAQEDVAVMSALPNMSILAPCDPAEVQSAVWACAKKAGPTYLRLGKAGEPVLTADAPEPFTFGKVRLIRPGRDAAILSYGPITKLAVEVAKRAEAERGLSVAAYSAHTLKPLDRDRLRDILKQYRQVVVVEEHSARGGLAAEVKQVAWDCRASCDLATFSLQDEFIHVFGSQADLWAAHGITADAVFAALDKRGASHG
jgi:transketolase